MPRLFNKLCIVTGGARGIGYSIAEAFLQEGARVILTDFDVKTGQESAARLGCDFRELEVSQETHWEQIQKEFPQIDVLVNNAGITGFEAGLVTHDPENATLESWRGVHAVNLDGVFLGCRYAIKAMRAQKAGAIINISSRSGMIGIPAAAAYASSKAAVRNHTKSVALYCAQLGTQIRCNSIHPAAVMTPMWEPMLGKASERESNMEKLVKDIPLKRFAEPAEVAKVAVMLASDEATYITGTEITIDGGILAGSAASPGE